MGTINNIQIEIQDLDTQIRVLMKLLKEKNYKDTELKGEIEDLRLERNKLLASIK